MTTAQIHLARQRLRLGIANVGFWVLLATLGLFVLAWRNGDPITPTQGFLLALGAIAIQAVFDTIGGAVLMPEPRPGPLTFLRRGLRGAFGHTLILTGVLTITYLSFRLTSGFAAGVFLATLGLALGRGTIFQVIGGVRVSEESHEGKSMAVAAVEDPAFTGGFVGFGRRTKSLLPARWLKALPQTVLAVELFRREWQIANGLPGRAFGLVLVWNLLGTMAGSLLFALSTRPAVEALLGHACWMTLWTFASLLILPVLSGKAIFAADQAALAAGFDPREWISRFPELVGEDGNPRPAIQTIFYPIPSGEKRMAALTTPAAGFLPGSLARNNLYYSWATLTLLGRAVHCNVGRPALWVFPPSA